MARFGDYLLNLEEYLPEEHINIYKNGIGSQSCVYKDKWVSFVFINFIIFII